MNAFSRNITPIALILCISLAATEIRAENIDLVTLPNRDSVQLTIYNAEDITLVRETRYISLKRGENRLQFSWAGTLIDPTSVDFRPLEQADKIEVLDTVFPGQKPQALFWNIDSEFEGQVKVEVSYFTSGISWSMDYVAMTDENEVEMDFTGYVRIFNQSGAEYPNATVRLIVGKINLVEKIADLARRRGIQPPVPLTEEYEELKNEAMEDAIAEAPMAMEKAGFGAAMPSAAPKAVAKKGVSEYFMFTVEGTETISNQWSKRMRAIKADSVKFDIVYRMRDFQYGPRPVRFFIWKNDTEHKLGDTPLPNGRVRIFKKNHNGGLSFLGEQDVEYAPIGADIEINLGTDDLVVYESKKASVSRNNFSFRMPRHRRDEYVDGWDEQTLWLDTVRNYRDKPIRFELRRRMYGDIVLSGSLPTSLFDYNTMEAVFEVPARGKVEYQITAIRHFGKNQKQNRIRLR